MSESSRAFGLGCFAFEVAPSEGMRSFKVAWWQEEVQKALGAISSISEVDVSVDFSSLVDGTWPVDLASDGTPELQEFLPDPRGSRISFRITIPQRMHADLLDGQHFPYERFHVETFYRYHGPCTVVMIEDGDDEAEGALAVRLLWRFLKREFPKHSTTLTFTNLGPSPFHASFWLRGTEQDDPVTWQELDRQGYARIVLSYDEDSFEGGEQALNYAKFHLSQELALFYHLQTLRNFEYEIAQFVANQTSRFMLRHQAPGFRSAAVRMFRSGAEARRLGLLALSSKLGLARNQEVAVASIRETYQDSEIFGVLRDAVLETCPEGKRPELDAAIDVVQFAESGRSKEFEVAVVSASTLFGAAAGALAAVLAGGS